MGENLQDDAQRKELAGSLQKKTKIAYGVGAVGKDMVYMLVASYILYYYNSVLGVSSVFIGTVLMAARVFDAFNDPIMGIVVAKTRSRWGRFRPWIFSGTVLNAVVLYAMFAVPESMGAGGMKVFLTVTYFLWGITYTLMDIPYWSMIPAFTKGGKEREGLSAMARSCAGVGSAIVTIITMKCVYMLGQGDERTGFKWFALIIAVIFVLCTLATCINIREKSTVEVEAPSIRQMLQALIQNDQAMATVITIVLINMSIYITSNLVIYFFKYDFGGEGWYNSYTLFSTFGGAMQIVSMVFFFPLLRKFFNTIQVFYVSFAMAVIGYVSLLILAFTNMSNVVLLFIPGFFIFAANGMLSILTTVFLANTVDYGELKNNRRDESVIFSMQTFVVKLASGVAALVASICLSVFHLNSDTENTAEVAKAAVSSVVGLRMTMTLIPIAGLIIAGIFFHRKYKLTEEKVEEIARQVKIKHATEQN